jgi:two-component system sensor histidine kinase RpfC
MELEQAILRLVIGGALLGYIVWRAQGVPEYDQTVFVSVEGFVVLAFAIVVAIFMWPTPSPVRRVVGIVIDVGVATLFLLFAGETGAVIIGVYLFIIFGNGFRYGRSYLHLSQALIIVGFSVVMVVSPWWSNHQLTAFGMLTTLVIVPFYVGVLAQRLVDARLKAEQELKECREQNLRSN